MIRGGTAFVLGVHAAGCGAHAAQLDTDELQPIEVNRAPLPEAIDGDAYPETLSFVSGGGGDGWWAHARGYVHADTATVWAAALDPEVDVDMREVDEWSVTDSPFPSLDASYRIHNVVNDVITVEFDLWWRHELQGGTEEAPELVVALWDKTDGTMFIDLLKGSLVITPVEGETAITEVDFVEHLVAPMRDDQTLVTALSDLHADLVARAHGSPLPTFDSGR